MTRSPALRRCRVSAILVAAILPLAACGGSSDPEPEPGGDPAASSPTPEESPVTEPVTALSDRCPSFSEYGTATEYAGDGPHPIALFGNRDDTFHSFAQDALPADWTRDIAHEVQLVGCVNIVDGDEELATCDYSFGVAGAGSVFVPLHDRQYRIVVYEARTGRSVTNVKLDASSDECPASWLSDFDEFGDPLPMYTKLTAEELEAGLEALVTGPAM